MALDWVYSILRDFFEAIVVENVNCVYKEKKFGKLWNSERKKNTVENWTQHLQFGQFKFMFFSVLKQVTKKTGLH